MQVKLGNLELAGAFGESVSGLRLVTPRQLQISPVFRAAPKTFDRGPGAARMTFSVTRQHTSVVQAVRFILQHPGEVAAQIDASGKVSLSLVYADEQILMFFHGAKVEAVEQGFEGRTTRHSYQIVGKELSTIPES